MLDLSTTIILQQYKILVKSSNANMYICFFEHKTPEVHKVWLTKSQAQGSSDNPHSVGYSVSTMAADHQLTFPLIVKVQYLIQ